MNPFRALINAYLVWFYSHFAFFILGFIQYEILMLLISWVTLLLSLPVLVLYLVAGTVLCLLRLPSFWEAALLSAFCLAVTVYFAFGVVDDKGGGPDSLDEFGLLYLRIAAVASTAISLLLVVWLSLRKQRKKSFSPSGSGPSSL